MSTLLRLATAGSVDDGKSTLVGRLLHDSKSVLADQLDAVERVSRDRGLASADLALLTDGLRAEREQGITIDVAYRYFATAQRSFVLADCPGHVQYTRNTVTGSSTADASCCSSTPARACSSRPAATWPSPRCCACRTSSSPSTRSTSSTSQRGRLPPVAAEVRAVAARARHRRRARHPGHRPSTATTSSTARRTRPGTTGPRLLELLETLPPSTPTRRTSRSGCRCSSSSARRARRALARARGLPRVCRPARLRRRCASATRSSCCRRAAHDRRRHRPR